MKTITETTLIPISLVITLVGGIVWLSTLYARTEETAKAIIRVEANQQGYNENLREIISRLSRIEGALGEK